MPETRINTGVLASFLSYNTPTIFQFPGFFKSNILSRNCIFFNRSTSGQNSILPDTLGQNSIVTRKGLAGGIDIDEKLYERRLAQLLEGEPENEYDVWLRDRFYPIVAGFTVPDNCGLKARVILKDDEDQE